MKKYIWIIVLVFFVILGGMFCAILGIIKSLRVEVAVKVPEKITIELAPIFGEIRIPTVDGSLKLTLPTKYEAKVKAEIPSNFGIKGSLNIDFPRDFDISIQGLDKLLLQCPYCKDGNMIPVMIKFLPLGKAKIIYKCTKCGKELNL